MGLSGGQRAGLFICSGHICPWQTVTICSQLVTQRNRVIRGCRRRRMEKRGARGGGAKNIFTFLEISLRFCDFPVILLTAGRGGGRNGTSGEGSRRRTGNTKGRSPGTGPGGSSMTRRVSCGANHKGNRKSPSVRPYSREHTRKIAQGLRARGNADHQLPEGDRDRATWQRRTAEQQH